MTNPKKKSGDTILKKKSDKIGGHHTYLKVLSCYLLKIDMVSPDLVNRYGVPRFCRSLPIPFPFPISCRTKFTD